MLDDLKVRRTDTGHIAVGDKFFCMSEIYDAAEEKLRAAGAKNIPFNMAPFFYTGCPYGQAIMDLGVSEVSRPRFFRVEVVPHDGKRPFRFHEPIWPEVFGLDQSLYES